MSVVIKFISEINMTQTVPHNLHYVVQSVLSYIPKTDIPNMSVYSQPLMHKSLHSISVRAEHAYEIIILRQCIRN